MKAKGLTINMLAGLGLIENGPAKVRITCAVIIIKITELEQGGQAVG
jgi:hypothetical protein